MTTYLYFGYGSNMNQNILTAKGMTVHRSVPCIVHNYKLVFNLAVDSIVEPGYANVQAEQGASVHGVCHEISDKDIKQMDGMEKSYSRINVPGALYDGKAVNVELYIIDADHNEHGRELQEVPPSRRYLRILLEGAREYKLDPEYIAWLETFEVTPPPALVLTEGQRKLLESKVWSLSQVVAHMDANPGAHFMVLRGIVFNTSKLQFPEPYLRMFTTKTRQKGCATYAFGERYGKGSPQSVSQFTAPMMQYVDAHVMDLLRPERGAECIGSMDDRAKWDIFGSKL